MLVTVPRNEAQSLLPMIERDDARTARRQLSALQAALSNTFGRAAACTAAHPRTSNEKPGKRIRISPKNELLVFSKERPSPASGPIPNERCRTRHQEIRSIPLSNERHNRNAREEENRKRKTPDSLREIATLLHCRVPQPHDACHAHFQPHHACDTV